MYMNAAQNPRWSLVRALALLVEAQRVLRVAKILNGSPRRSQSIPSQECESRVHNVPFLRALALLVQAQRALQRLALKPLLPKQSLAPRQLRGHLAFADECLGHPRHQDLLRRKTGQCSNRSCMLPASTAFGFYGGA